MTEPERWSAVFHKDRRVAASDGTSLAYTVRGDGPGVPVAFINGWTCPDAYWTRIGPSMMARGHPVVYLDLRGHGDSGLPRDPGFCANRLRPEDVSAERLATDVLEILDAAGVGPAVLVGHSMGAEALIEAARLGPDQVVGLVPVAGAYENPVKSFYNLAILDRLYPAMEMLLRVVPLEVLGPVIRHVNNPDFGLKVVQAIRVAGKSVQAEDMQSHFLHAGHVNFSVLFKIMSALRAHHTEDFLPQITQPTLILAGRKDVFTPPTVQARMAELIPDATIVWFEEGGHLLPIEETDGIIAALGDFLDGLQTGRIGA